MRLIDADALCIPPEEMNAKMAVAYAPTIDAVPVKHGEWLEELDRKYHWHCSECGYVIGPSQMDSRYCPNCGAKMDGGKDEYPNN